MPFSKNLDLGMPFPCKYLMYKFHCIHRQVLTMSFFILFTDIQTHQQHFIICAAQCQSCYNVGRILTYIVYFCIMFQVCFVSCKNSFVIHICYLFFVFTTNAECGSELKCAVSLPNF